MAESAEFLFLTWEGGGHVTPALIVARALRDRGRRVLVVSDDCNAADAAAFGVPFEGWRNAPNRPDKSADTDPLKDYEAGSPAETVARVLDRVMVGPAEAYARDATALLDAHPGAVVVAQELLLGAMIGAEAKGAPLALLTANLWPYPTLPGVPPFGAGFEPAQDDYGRMRDENVRQFTRVLYDQRLSELNATRERFGLPPLESTLDQPLRADRVLLGVSPAFDFAPDPVPAPFAYVGPQFADPAWVEAWDDPFEPGDARPLVVVSFSTFYQGHDEPVRRAAQALAGLDVRGLVLLGPSLSPADVPSPAPNVKVVQSAPFAEVLTRAALVITHAGHASAVRPLLEGVPVLCMPLGRDQPDNAARVLARGAGLALAPDASVQQIRASAAQILGDSRFSENAGRLGRAVRESLDATLAPRLLEALR